MGLADWWRNRGRDLALYPEDENGDVLWQMVRRGDDLTKMRKMDFFFLFRDQASAREFCEQTSRQGFETSLSYFEEKRSWDVECSIKLLPTHAQVTAVERLLSTVAEPLGGEADGWGSHAQ